MTGKLENIDLTPDQHNEVRGLLQRHLPDTEIWAYGSRVKFSSIPSSDLDLVVFASPEQSRAVSELKEAFDESYLPFQVDLFVWDKLPKTFHKSIMEAWMVLQEKKKGKLPRGWGRYKLQELASIKNGKRNSQDASEDGKYPLFDRSQKIKRSDKYLFDGDSIIVPGEGKEFIPRYYRGKFDLHQRCYALFNFKSTVEGRYLYYYLMNHRDRFVRNAVGSTVASLRLNHFQSFPIILPPLPEQRRIAGILGSLDDKIELNRRMSETLEAMSQAIFKSWFIDFDPVIDNALAAGKEIPEVLQARAKARQSLGDKRQPLPPLIQSLFPAEFELTPQGPIPKGWKITTMKDTVKIIKGRSYKSSELSESDTALVTLKSFNRGGGYRIDGLKEYTGPYKPEQEVFTGDLVIACTDITQSADVVGKPAIVVNDRQYSHLVISLDAILIRPTSPEYVNFFYNLAHTERFQNHMLSYSTGTTVLHLNKDAIPKFEFVMPEQKIMKAHANYVKGFFDLMTSNIINTNCLTASRESLLPRLLSGKWLRDG